MQHIMYGGGEAALMELLTLANAKKPFVVCDGAFDFLPCARWAIAACPRFSDFTANPRLEDVMAGARAFLASGCDAIVAIGGGSAMDTAKCIRAFYREEGDVLHLPVADTGVPLIAVPSTAGTGSESTHFAVVYQNGVKHSVAAACLRPGFVLLEGELLRSLPLYQKKCTMLDALCQAIESAWSKKSSPESRGLSERAVRGIMRDHAPYLAGDMAAAQRMLMHANLAGQAIDLTTTTAAHAMSYKLTSLYALPHGHAVAVCMLPVWRRLDAAAEFSGILSEIGAWMGAANGAERFCALLRELGMDAPAIAASDMDALAASVNAQRLSNHPQALGEKDLREMYGEVAEGKDTFLS